jgi:DNA-binding transcriptional LysR family regulator
MLVESALKGIGYARVPSFAVNKHIKNGRLVHLLPEYKSLPERSVYAIYPDKRFLPLKVRKFIDLLSDYLINIDEKF